MGKHHFHTTDSTVPVCKFHKLPRFVQRTVIKTREEMERFANITNFPFDLCGLCGIASSRLVDQLKKESLSSSEGIHWNFSFVIGVYDHTVRSKHNNHCWVLAENTETEESFFIDITATQFGNYYQRLYITEVGTEDSDPQYHVRYTGASAYKSIHSMVNPWPESQQPRNYPGREHGIHKRWKDPNGFLPYDAWTDSPIEEVEAWKRVREMGKLRKGCAGIKRNRL